MFTAKITIKSHDHLTGVELAGALRGIAEEIDAAMDTAPAESTHQDAVLDFHARPTIAWTADVDS